MAKKRKKTKSRAGSGSIDERGDGVYRLRYRIGGRRFTQTVKVDTRQEAEDRLLKILGKKQDHVAPSKKRSPCGSMNGLQPVRRAARSGESDSARLSGTVS